MEKSFLRSLSPVKKDESNEAIDFLNSVLFKNEEKPSIHREDSRTISRTASTFDSKNLIDFNRGSLFNVCL
jgi:hypothetical protein